MVPAAGAAAVLAASLVALWMWQPWERGSAPPAAPPSEAAALAAAAEQPAPDDLARLDSLPLLLGELQAPRLRRVDMLNSATEPAPAPPAVRRTPNASPTAETAPPATSTPAAPLAAVTRQPSSPNASTARPDAEVPSGEASEPAALAGYAAAAPTTPPTSAPAPNSPVDSEAAGAAAEASRAAVATVVSSYARAVESRDIATLRGVYPGLSDEQRAAWERFFGSVRSLQAELDVQQLEVTGSVAEATVTGAYAYVSRRTRRNERMPVSFQAVLTRGEGGNWRLSAIR